MNISAISMVNRMPSFSANKQVMHRNSDEDWWVETVHVEEPKDEVVIRRNSEEDCYAAKVNKPKTKTNAGMMREIEARKMQESLYELGPDGKTWGVWTRNGGDDVFFTPASAIEAKPNKTHAPKNVESDREYYERKLYSPEWIG